MAISYGLARQSRKHWLRRGTIPGIFTQYTVVSQASKLAVPFDTAVTPNQYMNKECKPFPDAPSPIDVSKHEGLTVNLRRCLECEATAESLLNCVHHYYLKWQE